MVFAHRHYLKAGRDTWVHQRSCVVSKWWAALTTLAKFAESSWNGAANSSGPITGRWVLITWGWSGAGRGSLTWGLRDGKEWVTYKVPRLKKYPHLPPTVVLPTPRWILGLGCQDQAAPQRPAQALGRDRGWGWRQSRVKRGEKRSYGWREGAVTKDKKWKPEPPVLRKLLG